MPVAPTPRKSSAPVLLALGFRPFFLLAGLMALAGMGAWVAVLAGLVSSPTYFDPVSWHRHEMLFGYTAAVIAGFLLTAVQNWTGLHTVRGWPLGALAFVWIGGRVLVNLPTGAPGWLVAAVDLAFLPLVAIFIGLRIWQKRLWNNYAFVLLLLLLTVASALMHAEALGLASDTAHTGALLGLDVIVLMITVIGGRVLPFFVRSAMPQVAPRTWAPVERAAIAGVAAVLAVDLLAPGSTASAAVLAFACAAGMVRMLGWRGWRTGSTPLLWVLFVGYGWLVLGLGLRAAAVAQPLLASVAAHALTVGAIGGLTLGMMARVALGHTGREMRVGADLTAAFVLVNLAAVVRVLGPLIAPSWMPHLYTLSGVLWLAAFGLFLARYAPILVSPRVDGRAG